MRHLSLVVAVCALALTSACASHSGATREGRGLTVRISSGDDSCRTVNNGSTKKRAGVQPLPNDRFCHDLRRALAEALDRRGFRTVANDTEPADLVAALRATQTVSQTGDISVTNSVRVDVTLRATAAGEEVEVLAMGAQHADEEALVAYLSEATQSLADGLAASSGVRAVKPGARPGAFP